MGICKAREKMKKRKRMKLQVIKQRRALKAKKREGKLSTYKCYYQYIWDSGLMDFRILGPTGGW